MKYLTRRGFIKIFSLGLIFLCASLLGMLSFLYRYFFPNVIIEPDMNFIAGYPQDFNEGIDLKFASTYGVFIYRKSSKIVAISTVCTHLGCIPGWSKAEEKFKCPCHGSGFYASGINFEGPAPRPLERFKIGLNTEGRIVIDKTKVFRQEKGEWSYPGSFIEV